MHPNSAPSNKSSKNLRNTKGKLEDIANAIDPAGTEVGDEEIMDPGANTHDFRDQADSSVDPPSKPK